MSIQTDQLLRETVAKVRELERVVVALRAEIAAVRSKTEFTEPPIRSTLSLRHRQKQQA